MKQISITILLFISFKAFSQTDTIPSHKIISLNLTQFVLPEMRLTYEHSISKKINFAYSLGFRLQQKNALDIYVGRGTPYLGFAPMANRHYYGIYTSVMPKWKILKSETVFGCLELYNNFQWFNNRHAIYNHVEGINQGFDAIRTEKVNTTGLKFILETMIGGEERISKSRLWLSLFGGVGGFFRYYQFESSNGTLGEKPIVGVVKEKGYIFYPSIHVGIKLNCQFR